MLLDQVQGQHPSDWHPAYWASSSTGHVLFMHMTQKSICMQGNSIAFLWADMQMQQQFFSASDSRRFIKSDLS